MEQISILKKEVYRIKRPGRILVGDPSYFEEYEHRPERLHELVVDCRPKKHMEAGLVIKENKAVDPELGDHHFITMGIYLAPKKTIRTYLDDRIYQIQKIKEKETTERSSEKIMLEGSFLICPLRTSAIFVVGFSFNRYSNCSYVQISL